MVVWATAEGQSQCELLSDDGNVTCGSLSVARSTLRDLQAHLGGCVDEFDFGRCHSFSLDLECAPKCRQHYRRGSFSA
jgi:hypothetical protein